MAVRNSMTCMSVRLVPVIGISAYMAVSMHSLLYFFPCRLIKRCSFQGKLMIGVYL